MEINKLNTLPERQLTEPSARVRLLTLGRLALVARGVSGHAVPHDALDGLNKQRRKLGVLVVLALSARPLQRDALVEMFWGDQDEARARHSLTEALSHLRRVLGRDAIATRVEEVSLSPQSRIEVDALELAEAVRSQQFERAVELYAGPFLEAVHLNDAPGFERWADRERARLDSLYFEAAAAQCHALARARRWTECAATAAAWLERSPLSVDAALFRLNALKADGSPDGALRALEEYARLRTRLEKELDLAPDPTVQQLAREIEAQIGPAPAEAGAANAPATPRRMTPIRLGEANDDLPPAKDAQPSRRRTRLIALAMATGVLLFTAVSLTVARRRTDSRADPALTTVAVLPFTDLSADTTSAYLAGGMADQIANALSRVDGVRLVATASIDRLVAEGVAPREIARRLGADAAVEGTIRTTGDSAHVEVRLTGTQDGRSLWTGRYGRDVHSIAATQADIARGIAAALGPRSLGPVTELRRPDPATYDLYLRGRYLENRSGAENLRAAMSYYEHALSRDSSFAPAYAGMASVQMTLFFWGNSYGEVAPRARAYADRALQLDPGSPEAHAALAGLLRYDWRWAEAELEYRRALAANPSDVSTRHSLSHLYLALGQVDESLAESQQALALDPLNPRIGMHLCVHYVAAHRYEDALAACRRGLELDPNFPDSHAKLGSVYVAQARYADAANEVEREMTISGRRPEYEMQLAVIEAARGHALQARTILHDIERRVPTAHQPLVTMAAVDLRLGDVSAALARLEDAYVNHSSEIEALLLDPEFDPIRSDPRFQALLAKVGLSGDPLGVRSPALSRSLAVLPFTHTSAQKGKEYFTAGLTDEITNALGTVPGLRVVARTSVAALRPRNLEARALARSLNADALLEGSVQIQGERARIVAQLVDATTGYRIWSGRYDRQLADILAVQDELTRTIVTALQLQLQTDSAARPSRTRASNPGAHDLYLRGRYVAEQRGESNFRTAITNFEQAIALDSAYARAWAGLATTRISLADRGVDARTMYIGAKQAAEHAVGLDSALSEPRVALGRVYYYGWEWHDAERELRRAIELNPNDAEARHWYAHALMTLGRTGEANVQQSRMLELDPYGPQAAFHPCWQHYELRQLDRALAACRRALELHPNQPEAHTKLGFVFWATRSYDSAVVAFARELSITPDAPTAVANLAMALASAGRVDSAGATLRYLERATPAERLPAMDVACAYIALGNPGRALSILERAAVGRRQDLAFARGHRDLANAKYEPCLDPIRSSPRFVRVLRALGLP